MDFRKNILVTGSSGFIGMNLCIRLLGNGFKVLGIDNMNNYYDVNLKKLRLERLLKHKDFTFKNIDISDLESLNEVFKSFNPFKVVNLAAQAGVRYSIQNPHSYIFDNIAGFMNILECVRNFEVRGLIYASSSSVYGGNSKLPFSVKDNLEKQVSIYGVSKRANELMAQSYSYLYNIHSTGLRFFTVYGPWGRPDMAMYIFTKNINEINSMEDICCGNLQFHELCFGISCCRSICLVYREGNRQTYESYKSASALNVFKFTSAFIEA